MEDVNYKMEIEEVGNVRQQILLKNQEFSVEEKKEAFKKKVTKMQGK